mmetsp:Transcript_24603/g.37962  ORF Transcript_24603/g.37962 Transcript_24603/m.37962 type:complete len:108 (+) Transcript_24603:56-379(+)
MSAEDNGHDLLDQGDNDRGGRSLEGSEAMRPVFVGNLIPGFSATDITDVFERPRKAVEVPEGSDPNRPIPVDRVDVKRGYCFIFLKDAESEDDKRRIERYVSEINGM